MGGKVEFVTSDNINETNIGPEVDVSLGNDEVELNSGLIDVWVTFTSGLSDVATKRDVWVVMDLISALIEILLDFFRGRNFSLITAILA